MYQTSALWKSIVATKAHNVEYKVTVDGTTYDGSDIADLSITRSLMDGFSVGGANCAELYLSFYPAANPARAARILVEARVTEGGRVSEWIPMGTFWIDSRVRHIDGMLEITAFDGMMKAERIWTDYLPSTSLNFPITMSAALESICDITGLELDSRVHITNYNVEYPNDLTMREVLGYIAAAHGGNWFITNDGKLMLSCLKDTPEITTVLGDELGHILKFGEVKIRV